MTPEAALDQFAFLVGSRLMGADARRRLRIALVRSPEFADKPAFDVERIERIEAFISGSRQPETLQDHIDLNRAEQDRCSPPFSLAFWAAREAELILAGFAAEVASALVEAVRAQVGDHSTETVHDFEPETPPNPA